MTKRHTVKDRLTSLSQATPNPTHTTEALAELMLQGFAGEPTSCTVTRHFRTRILDFPGIELKETVTAHTIYNSRSVRADVVGDLHAYFKNSNEHYLISPPLRHEIKATLEKLDPQGQTTHPFLVIQEVQDIEPFLLEPCAVVSEVANINGGRDNASFILAIRSAEGTWPTIPSNELTIKAILAVVRASQNADAEIRKHIDQSCLLTDDDRFVSTMEPPSITARLSSSLPIDAIGFQAKMQTVAAAMTELEGDLQSEHINLLVNTLYMDDFRDDCFRRLHYLSLWQSLDESRKKLGYIGPQSKNKLVHDDTIIAGNHSLAKLTQYRHDVAHWRNATMDDNYLADMYLTLNELIRRKYFQATTTET